MRYRLTVKLPREVDVGSGVYVLDLVDAGAKVGCWLRAHEREEPVVFLLARFPDRTTALARLGSGFEVAELPLLQRLLQRLTDEGAGVPVRPERVQERPVRRLAPQPRQQCATEELAPSIESGWQLV